MSEVKYEVDVFKMLERVKEQRNVLMDECASLRAVIETCEEEKQTIERLVEALKSGSSDDVEGNIAKGEIV